jgi:hypothetical protein
MTCAVLAIGNEEEQKALREYLDDDEDETPEDQQSQDTERPTVMATAAPGRGRVPTPSSTPCAPTIDMNEVMRAAIDATEEGLATVRNDHARPLSLSQKPVENTVIHCQTLHG